MNEYKIFLGKKFLKKVKAEKGANIAKQFVVIEQAEVLGDRTKIHFQIDGSIGSAMIKSRNPSAAIDKFMGLIRIEEVNPFKDVEDLFNDVFRKKDNPFDSVFKSFNRTTVKKTIEDDI